MALLDTNKRCGRCTHHRYQHNHGHLSGYNHCYACSCLEFVVKESESVNRERRIKDIEDRLAALERAGKDLITELNELKKAPLPKEPSGTYAVIKFSKKYNYSSYSYAAIKCVGRWFVTTKYTRAEIANPYSWKELLEFIGEESHNTILVADSWKDLNDLKVFCKGDTLYGRDLNG